MTKWTSKALGRNAAPIQIDESLLDELVVILLQGKNVFDKPIYSYLQLSLRSLQALKAKMTGGGNFTPSDFGTVVAAGQGMPTDDVRAEMAELYNVADIPGPRQQAIPVPSIQPKIWEEEEGKIEDGGSINLDTRNTPSV